MGYTIKELAKKLGMSYRQTRYFIRRLNLAGVIKPAGIRGRETEWQLTDKIRKELDKIE